MPFPTTSRAGALGLALAASFAALAAAEGALRWLRPEPASEVIYPCFSIPDPRTGFRFAPHGVGRIAAHFEFDHEVHLDSQGFHDAEPLADGEADPRVLAVGDSFTAALQVPDGETWVDELERRLRAGGHPRADVVNLGLDGTGTDVHLALLEQYVPRFRPTTTLVAFFANDAEDVRDGRFTRECHRGYVLSYQSQAQRDALRAQVDRVHERRALRWLFQRSYLVRLALVALEGPATPYRLNFRQPSLAALGLGPEELHRREAWPRASFEALARFAERCDCGLVIVPVPARRDLAASLELARGLAAGLPLEIVDVLPRMRAALARDGREPADLFFRYDAHLDGYGNRLFAEALADAIAWPTPLDASQPGAAR
jgi:lysophospholipase L1-like esterase